MPDFDLDAVLSIPAPEPYERQSGRWTMRLITSTIEAPRQSIPVASWVALYDGEVVGRGDFPWDYPSFPNETFEQHCQSIWELSEVVWDNTLRWDREEAYSGLPEDFWEWVGERDIYA